MLGLYRRALTGQGMSLTTSLMANGAWANACFIQAALVGAEFPPKSTRSTTANPIVNHYLTRDRSASSPAVSIRRKTGRTCAVRSSTWS